MHAPSARRSSQQPSWMRPITERLSPVIKTLVVVYSILFFLGAFVERALLFAQLHLVLGPGVYRGELWQPFTTLFVHVQFLSYAFNMLGLWFVGAAMERELGRRRFFTLFFVPAIAANLVMVGLGFLLRRADFAGQAQGCGLAILALFVAFGTYYGRTPSRVLGGLVLEARTLVAILVGFSLLVDLMQGSITGVAGTITAVVIAYAVTPGNAGGLFAGLLARAGKRGKPRRKLEVLEGGRRGRDRDLLN